MQRYGLFLKLPSVIYHFYRCQGKFLPFVAYATARAGLCLFHRVDGEQAVDDGDLALGVEGGETLCGALADVVEVGRIAANYAADGYDGIYVAALGHEGGAIDEFETAGHAAHRDAGGAHAISGEGVDRAFQQAVGDLIVPFAHDEAHAHIGGIGNGGNVFAEIKLMGGHRVGEFGVWRFVCE